MDPLRPIQVTKSGRTQPSCSSRVRTGYIASCSASRQSAMLWFSSDAMPGDGVGAGHIKWLRGQNLLFTLVQQDGDFLPVGRQYLRCLGEHRSLFALDMLLDVISQGMESGLNRHIVVGLLQGRDEVPE